ncbi:hypothetical protein DO021_01655 [Desulfobacter hydrogenophilus]|uniref:Uncharacterized protein n=1 Tax=Desulfobacter hydrogenophilus TaxID=2291 RepID=A0A328FGN8_9BACT|nr:hypothetical protein [Desulfobacter hydrogenophilus]NDY71838.1 hypothetical protein [Desulfobacter hydrogenophilus]QBH13534.1 hypothetical protein EYB58_11725 [Desulfobacter hydrogenophilus]RAM03784.1 hypothetical protein DO021_01655 [Desulfobacter hydrogenophilus]
MKLVNQAWFEMNDIIRKDFNRSVWIPLRAVFYNEKEGKPGYDGYKEDFFGTGSVAIPVDKIEAAKKLGWMDVGISHEHSGWVEDGEYTPAELYKDCRGEFEGTHLLLAQRTDDDSPNVWHLNQDLVITLGLIREGNSWLCPKDGYTEVARLKTSDNEAPAMIEVKSQYLKDYLCARKLALYMTHYFSRNVVCDDASHISWQNGRSKENNEQDSWEGIIMEIHEGGHSFGKKMAVFHVSRTDVDESDDVPDISGIPTDENTNGESWEKEFEGRKLYRISGELWRNEILMPGASSPKVRGDETDPTVFFIVDAEGNKSCGRDLIDSGKWLWFKPDLIMALYHRRGGHLSFYTEQTGTVSCSYGSGTHFGINELGLLNVYAKDVGLLPEWQQQIWAGYNISPEGGVSSELLASQVRAEPASTMAPEEFLSKGIEEANKLSLAKLGIRLFRDHEVVPELIKKAHRFRSIDESSFYALAKDLARLIADSLDAQAMQTIVAPPKKQKWGSLKSLENLLAAKYELDFIRKITAPLVGIYELRHADAHLPSSKIEEAFNLIEIDRDLPFVHQGLQMLHQVVSSIYGIVEGLRRWE